MLNWKEYIQCCRLWRISMIQWMNSVNDETNWGHLITWENVHEQKVVLYSRCTCAWRQKPTDGTDPCANPISGQLIPSRLPVTVTLGNSRISASHKNPLFVDRIWLLSLLSIPLFHCLSPPLPFIHPFKLFVGQLLSYLVSFFFFLPPSPSAFVNDITICGCSPDNDHQAVTVILWTSLRGHSSPLG